MKKPVFVAVGVLAALLLVIGAAYSQEDMTVVSNEVFDNPQRGAAVFVHDEHNEAAGLDDCAQCHHLYDDTGNIVEDESSEDQACADCHGDKDEEGKPNLTKAYHLNCKNCHLQGKKGPIVCAQCHIKD
jgi:hypothetical protein